MLRLLPRRFIVWQILIAIHVLCILLWLALPFSPISSTEQQSQYIQTQLRAGSRLTTIHNYGATISDPIPASPGDYSPLHYGFWSGHIFDWQLLQDDPATDNITLRLGRPKGGIFPDFGADIDLTSLAKQDPCFVREGVHMWIAAGDRHFPSLPYFSYADSTLLFHQSQRSWKNIYLRLLVPERGTVQIWKPLPGWETFTAKDIPSIDDIDREMGLIASFTLPQSDPSKSEPPLSSINATIYSAQLPTRTQSIRSILLYLLTPLLYTIEFLHLAIIYPASVALTSGINLLIRFLPIYMLLVLLCFLIYNRTGATFESWARNFWMTRFFARRIFEPPRRGVWGASGPLLAHDGHGNKMDRDDYEHYRYHMVGHDDDHDDYENTGMTAVEHRARPLTGPVAFFKSSSPLDDLLVTFRWTQWMVRPVWPERGRVSIGGGRRDRYRSVPQEDGFGKC